MNKCPPAHVPPEPCVLVVTERGSSRHSMSFKGIWTEGRPGGRFERRRLMKMSHRRSN
jgi:hypothetical protein